MQMNERHQFEGPGNTPRSKYDYKLDVQATSEAALQMQALDVKTTRRCSTAVRKAVATRQESGVD
jgi:chitodextrinase